MFVRLVRTVLVIHIAYRAIVTVYSDNLPKVLISLGWLLSTGRADLNDIAYFVFHFQGAYRAGTNRSQPLLYQMDFFGMCQIEVFPSRGVYFLWG